MGTYVQNPQNNNFIIDAPNSMVAQRFSDTLQYAEGWKIKADDALAQLLASLSTLGMPASWLQALEDIEVPTVNVISPGTRPILGTLVLPDDWPEDFPDLPQLKATPNVDLSYSKPVKPDQVNPTLGYAPGTYDVSLYVTIFNKVQDILQNGGTGMNRDIENALLARRREQQRLSNADKYDSDMRAAGATGFNFPGGMVAGIVTDSSNEVLRQNTDFNNAIMIQAYESEQKGYFFALEKSLDMEKILRDFYNQAEVRSFEAKKAVSEFIIQVYAENVKGYIAEWDGVKAELESKKTLVELVISENTLILESFKAQATAYISKVDATSKKISGIVEGYKGQVAGYVADTQALEAYYNTLTAQQRLQIENADLKLRKATAELEFILKNKTSTDALTEKITETVGHIAQQAVASALNAVNASASFGYSGSLAKQEHWSHGENIGESHSYEHDPTA